MNSLKTMVAQKEWQRPDPRFYGVPTEELLLDRSWILQCRLNDHEDPDLEESTRRNSLQYWDHRLAPIEREVERRREQFIRHRGNPGVPTWPAGERHEKTVRIAQELKAAIPLSVYISDALPGTSLTRTGATWKGHCPFGHEDRRPSFVIYDDRRFTCFSCGQQGDIFAIVAIAEGLERFIDQVRALAAWAGRALTS